MTSNMAGFCIGMTVEVMFNRRWQRATIIATTANGVRVDLEGRKVFRLSNEVRLPITNRG